MRDSPPRDGSPNPREEMPKEEQRQVTPFLKTTRSSFPAISRKSISGSSDLFKDSGASSGLANGRPKTRPKPPPLSSPTLQSIPSPEFNPSTPDGTVGLLAHKSELLATLKTTVEGKMLFDPMIPSDLRMGQDPRTGIEIGRKEVMKPLFILILISLVVFIATGGLYLTNDMWECTNLCGSSCGFIPHEGAMLSDCEVADNMFEVSTSPTPNRYGSVFLTASKNCYMKGFCDVAFTLVLVGKTCSIENFMLPVSRGDFYYPVAESGLTPRLEFMNITTGYYEDTRLFTPCLFIPWKSSWVAASWSAESPTLGNHNLIEPHLSKSMYMEWGQRGNARICGKHDYDFEKRPEESGDLQMRFVGNVTVSMWNRYFVVVAEVMNDAHKTSLSTAAKASHLFEHDIAESDPSTWGFHTTRLSEYKSLINQSSLNLFHIRAQQHYDRRQIETPSVANLNCLAGNDKCENLPLLIQYDTAVLGSAEEDITITILIKMNSTWELSYEDIVISTYKMKSTYTIVEMVARYTMLLITMIVTIYYIHRIRTSPGGWNGLFVEQVWTLYGLIFLILHLNPFYALTLTERDLSEPSAKFGWVAEVESAYHVFYCAMITLAIIIHSSQVQHTKRDLFQGIDKTNPRKYSKLALLGHLLLAMLLVFQILGRSDEGFIYDHAEGVTLSLGSTKLQHRVGFVIILIMSSFIVIGTIRARQMLSTTHYTPARRKQLLLRFAQCVGSPYYVIVVITCLIEYYLKDVVSDTTYYLTTREQSTPHKWLGLSLLTFIYYIVQSSAFLPLNNQSVLPLPASRQSWLMRRWTPPMLKALNRHGTTYYFMSYAEELEWIMQQSSQSIEAAGVVAALIIAVRGSFHPPRSPSPSDGSSSGKSICYPFGLVDDNNFNISLDAMSGTDDASLDDSGNSRYNEGEKNRRNDESMQHMFCLQLACDMAIVCQEVYLNPPLRFLLKTSTIKLGSGAADGMPGCCVMAAAAVIPRTLVRSYKCDSSKVKKNAPLSPVRHQPNAGDLTKRKSIFDFRETLYLTSGGVQRTRPNLFIPDGQELLSSGSSCSDEEGPTNLTSEERNIVASAEDDDSTDEDRQTHRSIFNPNALLPSTITTWFGLPDKKDIDIDAYLAGNISRSYMTPDQYGWSLRSIVDKEQNRMMIITKRMTCADFEDTPYAYSQPRSRTPKASNLRSKKKRKGTGNEYHTICVCFRGTRNSTNIKSDLNIRRRVFQPMMRDYEKEWLGCFAQPPEIHSGFLEIWKSFKKAARKAVTHEIELAKRANKRIRIVCTGHSLGGAVSILAAYTFKQDHPDIWVSNYNFGTPRMANAAFCRMYEKLIPDSYRITHPSDQVPGHPFKCNLFGLIAPRYDHCCTRIRVDDFGNLVINPSWFETVVMDALPFSLIEIFNSRHTIAHAHSMKCYRTSMQRAANWAGHDFGLASSLEKTG